MVDTLDNLPGIEWLGKKIVGTGPDGVKYSLGRAVLREDNHAGTGASAANLLDEPLSVGVGQRQIGKDQIEGVMVHLHDGPGSGPSGGGGATATVRYELL